MIKIKPIWVDRVYPYYKKDGEKMRKDQCLFCNSRKCNTRIVSTTDNVITYDEVACNKHILLLEKNADQAVPKVIKLYQSRTSKLKRGAEIKGMLEKLK